MYSVMWSEHCSYKSSRVHLRRLPTEAPWVLVGPGENAGVVDVGDGIAAAIRIESHNHPSAIEPYQGAATGVGGILRDIFTMGARPIALMDPLRFGPLDDARSRWIAEGVVSRHLRLRQLGRRARRSAARSSSTRPTRATRSSTCCASACCPTERLVLGQADGRRQPRRAARLDHRPRRHRRRERARLGRVLRRRGRRRQAPAVQVGDPFEEKRLIEACLELLDAGLVVGIQDLGGAGLTLRHQRDRRPAAAWAWTSTSPPSPAASRAWSRSRS